MAVKRKIPTPITNNNTITTNQHPVESLMIGNHEQQTGLIKQQPIHLPNEIFENKSEENKLILKKLRNNFKYIYVIQWIYQCRGFIRLSSEYFDVDLFEIELLNLVNPYPIDEMILFINKLKFNLISKIQGKKIGSLDMFEPIFRLYFGSNTPLKGPEEKDEEIEGEEQENDDDDIKLLQNEEIYPRFDNLLIEDKIEIIYLLIKDINQLPEFKDFIDKNKISSDLLRLNSIYSEKIDNNSKEKSTSISEDFILVFDNTTLYKKIVSFPSLIIPKKRKNSPQDPNIFFKTNQFDIISIKFELIYKNIYQFNDYLQTLTIKKTSKSSNNNNLKKNKLIHSKLNNKLIIESNFNSELKKRKILANRRRDFEMSRLLATRKRSSRLEAKEKQKFEEDQERKQQQLQDLKLASIRRSERKLQHQEKFKNNHPDYTSGLSRQDRLDLRSQRQSNDDDNDESNLNGNEESNIKVDEDEESINKNDENEESADDKNEELIEIRNDSDIIKNEEIENDHINNESKNNDNIEFTKSLTNVIDSKENSLHDDQSKEDSINEPVELGNNEVIEDFGSIDSNNDVIDIEIDN